MSAIAFLLCAAIIGGLMGYLHDWLSLTVAITGWQTGVLIGLTAITLMAVFKKQTFIILKRFANNYAEERLSYNDTAKRRMVYKSRKVFVHTFRFATIAVVAAHFITGWDSNHDLFMLCYVARALCGIAAIAALFIIANKL